MHLNKPFQVELDWIQQANTNLVIAYLLKGRIPCEVNNCNNQTNIVKILLTMWSYSLLLFSGHWGVNIDVLLRKMSSKCVISCFSINLFAAAVDSEIPTASKLCENTIEDIHRPVGVLCVFSPTLNTNMVLFVILHYILNFLQIPMAKNRSIATLTQKCWVTHSLMALCGN